jgi:hypothetical protein
MAKTYITQVQSKAVAKVLFVLYNILLVGCVAQRVEGDGGSGGGGGGERLFGRRAMVGREAWGAGGEGRDKKSELIRNDYFHNGGSSFVTGFRITVGLWRCSKAVQRKNSCSR